MNYTTHDQWTSLVPTSLTYPNGRQVASGYDALYRRNSVTETSGGASIAAWQFFGNRTAKQTLGNGVTASMMNNAGTNSAVQASVPNPVWGDKTTDRLGYDGSGRMIAKRFLPSGSTTSRVGFTTEYDPASNKLFERALHAESRSALYPAYDSMNRLGQYQRGVLASGGGSVVTPITLPNTDSQRAYNLDGLGNWKTTTYTPEGGSPATENRTHNRLNEVLAFGVLPSSPPVLYDHGNNASSGNPLIAQRGNGNITDDGTRLYAYDALNRLTTVARKSDSATIAEYTYDAIGRRVQKVVTNGGITGTVANATYRYLYDDQQIVEELASDDSTLRQFVWGQYIDELTQLKTYGNTGTQPLAAGVYYPLQDLLYRTTATTNSSGNVVEAYDYDAYGNTLMYSGPGTDGLWFTDDDVATDQPACEFLFTGRQYDPETQIYFYRARYYQPGLGRFIVRDFAPCEMTPNLYQYCESKPITQIDPSGRQSVTSIARPCDGLDYKVCAQYCSKKKPPQSVDIAKTGPCGNTITVYADGSSLSVRTAFCACSKDPSGKQCTFIGEDPLPRDPRCHDLTPISKVCMYMCKHNIFRTIIGRQWPADLPCPTEDKDGFIWEWLSGEDPTLRVTP